MYVINNIDATVIAQKPKLLPHIDTMIENIAADLHLEKDQVNVKATTEEGLGFTGTGEGISSQAICMLTTPASLMDMQVDINQSSYSVDGNIPDAGRPCAGCGGYPRQTI